MVKWEDDVRETWRRQVWEATSRTKVRGPAGAVFGEMKDLGVTVPKLAGSEDGRWQKDSYEGYVPRRHQKDVDEANNGMKLDNCKECGWDPSKALLHKKKTNHVRTARHAKARSWVIS